MTTRTESVGRPQAAHQARAAWLVLTVLLLFSIAAPLNQFKVPPIMPVLMAAWNLSVSRVSLLMSLYAVTGLVLAIPSGLIFQRAGYRVTGLIAGGSIVIGAVMGAMSTRVGTLLASRVVEGVGTSFMAVLAPAIIAQWFITQRRGTAMGIWSAWVPVGSAMMLLIAPLLAQATGWRGVWWFSAIYALLVTVLYLAFVKPPPLDVMPAHAPGGGASAAGEAPAAQPRSSVLRNRDVWLLGAAFACFNMAVLAFATFMPTYLNTVRGLPLGLASLIASIATLITIFSAPGGGIVSDRIGSRKRPYLVGFALAALMLPVAVLLNVGGLVVLVVFLGLALGLVPTNIFSSAVEAADDPQQSGLAMAVIMVGQNAGALLGPLIFGALVETGGGWPLAFASLGVMSLGGLLAGWLARVR